MAASGTAPFAWTMHQVPHLHRLGNVRLPALMLSGTRRPPVPLDSHVMEEHMATETRETAGLIGSDKVEGTTVYGAQDKKIGSIERVMIGKTDGKVAYAVLSFGGFLGMGDEYYPIPWSQLTYDTRLGGYRTNISKEQLEKAPKFSNEGDWDWEDRERGRKVYEYYDAPWTGY
jgi:hypothetical protein